MNKQEILFVEVGKHYLLSTDDPEDTLLVTVTDTEVNFVRRFNSPNAADNIILVQATTVGQEVDGNLMGSILYKTAMKEKDLQEVFSVESIDRNQCEYILDVLESVRGRREKDGDQIETLPMVFLKDKIEEMLR